MNEQPSTLASRHYRTLRIATRQSKLALWQAHYVRQCLLQQDPQLNIVLLPMVTRGDQTHQLLHDGGKALFVKELQAALLADEADIAVHSLKDMSVHDHSDLCLAAICEREDPRDALISQQVSDMMQLPPAALVGTSSPRRQCQILALRPDLQVKPLRGNVDTRLKRVQQGDYAAIILAAAGLRRLQLQMHIRHYFDVSCLIPAIAQGAIAVECRQDDAVIKLLLTHLDHKPTRICVTAERAVNRYLGGDCLTPLGVHATWISQSHLTLQAMIGSLDGAHIIKAVLTGAPEEPEQLGEQLAKRLLAQGAGALLSLK